MKLAVITRAGMSRGLESHSGCIQLERLMGHPSGDGGKAVGRVVSFWCAGGTQGQGKGGNAPRESAVRGAGPDEPQGLLQLCLPGGGISAAPGPRKNTGHDSGFGGAPEMPSNSS